VRWFRSAAADGYPAAQYNLAIMYKLGQGVEQSHSEAIQWMQASANQGYLEAQSNLGNMYYQGLGVMQDYPLALMWWTLAEAAGAKDVQHNKSDIAKKMTSAQRVQTQQLVQQWQMKH
jgi:TPR repeat protein